MMRDLAVRPPAGWVVEHAESLGIGSVTCLNTGWGGEARAFKRQGWRVRTVDWLVSSAWWNRAFIQAVAPVGEPKVAEWTRLLKDPDVVKRFFPWAQRYFTPEETIWLGIWRERILGTKTPEQALGVAAVMWTMRYWLDWNRRELGFKPQPPVATFRHYVAQANAWRAEDGDEHQVEEMALHRVSEGPISDLLYCYVPSIGGIGNLGLAQTLWEQWILGDPDHHVDASFPLEVIRTVVSSGSYPRVAIAFGTDGAAVSRLISERRPVMYQRTLELPYPSGAGSGIMAPGLVIAGAPFGGSGAPAETRERES